jgi:hypothetical protein
LYQAFYRPDLVLAKFRGDQAAIDKALAEVGDVRELLQNAIPPKIELAKTIPDTVGATQISVPLRIIDQGGGVGSLDVWVNGQLIEAKAGHTRDLGISNIQVPLPAGKTSEIVFVSRSKTLKGKGPILSAPKRVIVTSSMVKPTIKPVLRGLAIGIEKYKDQSFTLKYASNDVLNLMQTIQQYSSPLFKDIIIEPLTDQNATLAAIKSAFERIPQKVATDDVFLLYLSGHGFATDGKFYFLPQDFIYSDPTSWEKRAITQDMLVKFMSIIPAGKLLFIIDACNASVLDKQFDKIAFSGGQSKGIAEITAVDRLFHSTGRCGLYASADSTIALAGYNNGSLYTNVLLEGLRGAASNGDYVSISDLAAYLEKKVPDVSQQNFGIEIFPKSHVQGSFPLTFIKK